MKKIATAAAILALMASFTGCQKKVEPPIDKPVVTEPQKAPSDTSKETPQTTPAEPAKQPEKPQDKKNPTNPSAPSSKPEDSMPVKPDDFSGVYIGQIDSSSIEVKINGRSTALFFSSEVKASFDPSYFKKGYTVKIDYYQNDMGQLVLTSISNSNYGIAVPGVYVGQMDNSSIEVKVFDKAAAFYLSDKFREKFKPSDYKAGTKVKLYYFKNSKGQTVLTGIEKR